MPVTHADCQRGHCVISEYVDIDPARQTTVVSKHLIRPRELCGTSRNPDRGQPSALFAPNRSWPAFPRHNEGRPHKGAPLPIQTYIRRDRLSEELPRHGLAVVPISALRGHPYVDSTRQGGAGYGDKRMNKLVSVTTLLFGIFPAMIAAQDYRQNALCVSGGDAVCSIVPTDLPGLIVNQGYEPNTNITGPGMAVGQANFDWFGWQMFVALNWPADRTGKPLAGPIGKDPSAPRVWQSFQTPDEVFPGNDVPPTSCAANRTGLVLRRTSKFSTASFIEPFTAWPLIDQQGNYVVYDIRMNPREIGYLQDHGLTTKAGQEKFTGKYDFPRGKDKAAGAIEIKTAWRILPDPSAHGDFYTTDATAVIPAAHSVTGKEMCLDVTVGLVGMHIMQKITNPEPYSDFWVWATFEHAANAPTASGATPSQVNDHAAKLNQPYDPLRDCPAPEVSGPRYSFFTPACTDHGAACSPNNPPDKGSDPAYLWQQQPPYARSYLLDGKFGTQVVRCWDIYQSARNVTKEFQAALAGTVWANYLLVGVQWAQSNSVEFPSPVVPYAAPFFLTNTTLETYLQLTPIIVDGKPSKKAPGSCIACHNLAADSTKKKSDFSFLPGYAK